MAEDEAGISPIIDTFAMIFIAADITIDDTITNVIQNNVLAVEVQFHLAQPNCFAIFDKFLCCFQSRKICALQCLATKSPSRLSNDYSLVYQTECNKRSLLTGTITVNLT